MIEITTNAREILSRFERLPSSVKTGVQQGLRRALLLVETRFRADPGIKSRRGARGMLGRLTSYTETGKEGGWLDGVIGFRKGGAFPYELSQEFGANAHKGAMAVPVSPEAKALSDRGQGPRDFPRKLFVPGLGRGRLVEAMRSRGAPMLVTHYVFIKSLPPRMKFRETVLGSGGVISDEVESAWKKAWARV